jgi:N-glycosylase/DNA lyase
MEYETIDTGKGIAVGGVKDLDLDGTLECGQSFRWKRNRRNDFSGIAGGKAARVRLSDGTLFIEGASMEDFEGFWRPYFDLDTDYGLIKKKLEAGDGVMGKALEFAPGIRLLKQPFFETLVSFIISANNSIPNIIRIIESLSAMYGEEVWLGAEKHHAFPAPEKLAAGELCDLKLSKAGYRCEYIKKTCAMYAVEPSNPEHLKKIGYENAKKELMKYPGVGSKVADCALLFSGIYRRAFPVDVWIKRIMESLYIGRQVPNKYISEFVYERFGELAGYAQQYLFHYARMNPQILS